MDKMRMMVHVDPGLYSNEKVITFPFNSQRVSLTIDESLLSHGFLSVNVLHKSFWVSIIELPMDPADLGIPRRMFVPTIWLLNHDYPILN